MGRSDTSQSAGYNLSEEIAQYGLDYSAYTMPGDLSDYRIRIPVMFEKDNLQFLHVYEEDELLEIVRSAQEITIHNPRLTGSSFYDEEGDEITENFRLAEEDIQQGGYGGGKGGTVPALYIHGHHSRIRCHHGKIFSYGLKHRHHTSNIIKAGNATG